MRQSRIFLYIFATLIFLTTCKDNKVGPDPKDPDLPAQLTIIQPSLNETYWTDEAVPCLHDATEYNAQTEWKVGDTVVSCTDGKFATEISAGTHTITATITESGESVTATVEITVKEAFSVTLTSPADGAEYFVGDQVTCEATVEPESYEEKLVITVGGEACIDGSFELQETGEVEVVASVTEADRTETDSATVSVKEAKPIVAGKVYPLTDGGVSSSAGNFTVTFTADGENFTTTTNASGNFSFSNAPLEVYTADEVTLEVAATGGFYGARAELKTYTPWTPDGDGTPVIAGEELLALVEAGELGFVLAPRTWQIRCGPFAGQSTSVKLPAAFKRYDPDRQFSSFYMYFDVFGKNMYRGLLPKDRPLPTAFNRAESEVEITTADSTTFWAETERVEQRICRGDLFSPATIKEVPTRDDGVQVMSTNDRPLGGARTNGDGHIIGGGILLPIDDFGGKNGYQAHELTQVLGFGETSEWVGVMSTGQFSGDHDFTKHSVDDIAHIQLYLDAVDLQHEAKVSFGIHAWRRVFDIPSLPDN